MRRRALLVTVVGLGLGIGLGCRKPKPLAPEPPPPPTVADPESAGGRAFLRLIELEGPWSVAGSEVAASFEKVGRGTAVAQHTGFYAVWFPDGSNLAATLFPDDGYHVTLHSTKLEETPGGGLRIELVADQVGNLPANGAIAKSCTFTLGPGGQQLTQRWVFRDAEGDKPVEIVLDRKTGATPPPAAPGDAGVPDAPPIDPSKAIFPLSH